MMVLANYCHTLNTSLHIHKLQFTTSQRSHASRNQFNNIKHTKHTILWSTSSMPFYGACQACKHAKFIEQASTSSRHACNARQTWEHVEHASTQSKYVMQNMRARKHDIKQTQKFWHSGFKGAAIVDNGWDENDWKSVWTEERFDLGKDDRGGDLINADCNKHDDDNCGDDCGDNTPSNVSINNTENLMVLFWIRWTWSL